MQKRLCVWETRIQKLLIQFDCADVEKCGRTRQMYKAIEASFAVKQANKLTFDLSYDHQLIADISMYLALILFNVSKLQHGLGAEHFNV